MVNCYFNPFTTDKCVIIKWQFHVSKGSGVNLENIFWSSYINFPFYSLVTGNSDDKFYKVVCSWMIIISNEEAFLHYVRVILKRPYMCTDVISRFKSSTIHRCVTRRVRVNGVLVTSVKKNRYGDGYNLIYDVTIAWLPSDVYLPCTMVFLLVRNSYEIIFNPNIQCIRI